MKSTKFLSTVTGILFLITMPVVMAHAAIPTLINYQGYLKDSGGNPVADGDYSITFSLYTVASGGTSEWTETQTVTLAGGVFDVQLGLTTAFPYSLFEADLYLGVWIVGEPDEMSPRQLLTATPFAMKAGDADTLEGQSSVDLDQSTHLADSSNPHNVTTVQVGAVTPADISAHTAVTDAHHAKTTSFTDLTDQASDSQIPATIARDAEVTWANLPDIPADFADGVDDVGGPGSEDDPEVGVNTLNYVPKWDGTALVTGSIFDNGNVGIGTPSPSAKLDVEVTSSGPAATIGSIGNSATGDFAIAMGYGTEAHGQMSTAMGNQTNATGFDSTAMGYGTTASGSDSTAMGSLTTASNLYSTAMGYGTTASGSYSTAMGSQTTASGRYSTATGSLTTASGLLSTAMGRRMIVQGDNSFGIGLNDTQNAITQDNTMAIMGGDVGIGTTAPAAKLHVITGIGRGVQGEHTNGNYGSLGDTWAGVYAEGIAIGVWAISNGPGAAIRASNTSTGDIFTGYGAVGGDPVFKVSNDGTTTTSVLEITGGSDLAEPFEIGPADIAGPGAVVCIDPENPGELEVSRTPYDRRVAGIISGAGGIKPGMVMGQEGSQAHGSTLVALTGRVFCRADASNGSIQPGDLLTTSDIPGHAMKVTDYTKAQGAIIGKAMTSLEKGKGLILVLVTLQ